MSRQQWLDLDKSRKSIQRKVEKLQRRLDDLLEEIGFEDEKLLKIEREIRDLEKEHLSMLDEEGFVEGQSRRIPRGVT